MKASVATAQGEKSRGCRERKISGKGPDEVDLGRKFGFFSKSLLLLNVVQDSRVAWELLRNARSPALPRIS